MIGCHYSVVHVVGSSSALIVKQKVEVGELSLRLSSHILSVVLWASEVDVAELALSRVYLNRGWL